MKSVSKPEEYVIASRRIAGTRAEKLEQIDRAIQELLDIKLLESAGDRPNVQFVTAPRRPHWLAMTVAILVMLVILVLLLGVRPAHAQDAGNPPPAPKPDSGKPADAPADEDIWEHVKFGVTLEGYYQYDGNRPDDRVIPLRAYDTRANGGQPHGPDGWFRVLDSNAPIAVSETLSLGADVTHTTNQVQSGGTSQSLDGVGAYARDQVAEPAAPTIRYEYLDDQGLFAGIAQKLQKVTATTEYRFADGFLIRGEFRRDWSNQPCFPVHDGGVSAHQNTALAGLCGGSGPRPAAGRRPTCSTCSSSPSLCCSSLSPRLT